SRSRRRADRARRGGDRKRQAGEDVRAQRRGAHAAGVDGGLRVDERRLPRRAAAETDRVESAPRRCCEYEEAHASGAGEKRRARGEEGRERGVDHPMKLLILMLVLAPATASAASEADKLIDRGVDLREQGKDQEALELFQKAYEIGKSPRALAQ